MGKKAKIAILIAIIYFFSAGIYYFSLSDEKKEILIKSGENAHIVAEKLKENDLICSKNLFLFLVKINNSAGKIKAGYYNFSRRDGILNIIKGLKTGSKYTIKVTVPEGCNIKQTAEILANKDLIDKETFIRLAEEQKMEGYLMPETYFLDPAMKEQDIINIMHKEFNRKVDPDMHKRAQEINMTMEDIITLASIVEKEAVKPEERSTIAAVFYNRIKKRIRLESCATVLYAMGTNKSRLTQEDTKFDSPYNTYRNFGLPPGPICSPGIESIKAALYPANSSSLFFVSAGDGSHVFSDNFEEHIQNKRKTKKIIAEKQSKK